MDRPAEPPRPAPGLPGLDRLQKALGYRFRDLSLLEEALTHRSLLNEINDTGKRDNERLEFLGDAVLGLVVAELLMKALPDGREGELTLNRAALVKRKKLADIARRLALGEYLYLGKGEERTAGRQKVSILADAFEAVVGAVFLDGGFDAARTLVQDHFAEYLEDIQNRHQATPDPKTRVQELFLAFFHTSPVYEVIEESGPEHAKSFHVRLCLKNLSLASGRGTNKKEAEQDAAERFLRHLEGNPLGMR
jgi:ribonuclease-3